MSHTCCPFVNILKQRILILQKDHVEYLNCKELKKNSVNTTQVEQFNNLEVTFQNSSVHIPVEIYDGSK